jgi:hypothetical protein
MHRTQFKKRKEKDFRDFLSFLSFSFFPMLPENGSKKPLQDNDNPPAFGHPDGRPSEAPIRPFSQQQ